MARKMCVTATVALVAALAIVMCVTGGCRRKPGTDAASTNTPSSATGAHPVVVGKVIDMSKLARLPKSEQTEIMRRLGMSNAPTKAAVKPVDPGKAIDNIPDQPFEPTAELKALIEDARRVFLKGLPPDEKIAALEKLSGTDHPIVNEIVMLALDDPNELVRETAVDLIMNINDASVVPLVVKALDDESDDIREYVLDALMDVDDPKSNEAFTKALKDENEDVRDNAMNIMLYISTPSVVESLAVGLNDPSEDIREKALITLEDISDKRVIDIMIEKGLLNDNESIREDTLDSINFITDQDFASYDQARAWWDRNKTTFKFSDEE